MVLLMVLVEEPHRWILVPTEVCGSEMPRSECGVTSCEQRV
jgi:hypothetical protein